LVALSGFEPEFQP